MLISGYKFDIRCYVLVRSYNPLTVYLYEEGLTRFATSPYDVNSLKNRFSHLTNTSINKFSPTLHNSKDQVGEGCKWNLQKLRDHFTAIGVSFDRVWERMKAIILLTLLPVAAEGRTDGTGCFELYGFDILVDENLRPWLLEVNLSPALSVDSCVDIQVKQPLLNDIILLLEISDNDAVAAQKFASAVRAASSQMRQKRKDISALPQMPFNTDYPTHAGNFTKIFPFSSTTRRLNMTKPAQFKNAIQELKKKYPSS